MRPLGASSFRGSYWASYSLTWTAAGDSALFLLPQTKEGQKEARELTENLVRIAAAELTNSAFNRYNCSNLKHSEPDAPSSRSANISWANKE